MKRFTCGLMMLLTSRNSPNIKPRCPKPRTIRHSGFFHARAGRLVREVLLIGAVLMIAAAPAMSESAAVQLKPLPAAAVELAPGLHPLGKGQYKFFGIRVYDATLWVVSDRWVPAEPHALDVQALRGIPAKMLVSQVIGDMDDLNVGSSADRQRWRGEMQKAVPTVNSGDQLVVLCLPNNKTVLFHNGTPSGELQDQPFCEALFKVWLDPRTKHERLRKELLNEKTP